MKCLLNCAILSFLILQAVACQPPAQELDTCNQTIHEKLALTKPYSAWFQVLCTKEGHIIKPAVGYQWFAEGGQDIYLNKTGKIQVFSEEVGYENVMNLQESWSEKARVDYVIKNYNDRLLKLKPDAPRYDDAHHLGFRGDMPFSYHLSILAKDSHPEYIIVCKEHCHYEEPFLIEVQRLNEKL